MRKEMRAIFYVVETPDGLDLQVGEEDLQDPSAVFITFYVPVSRLIDGIPELRELVSTLTRERDEARDELDGIAEVLDEAGVPQGADGPDGRRWTLGLGARVEHVIAERDEARAEVERLRAEVEKLRALPSAEDLEERAHEILDGAGIPTHALDPVSGEEDYRAGLEERLEWTVEEITRGRIENAWLRRVLEEMEVRDA